MSKHKTDQKTTLSSNLRIGEDFLKALNNFLVQVNLLLSVYTKENVNAAFQYFKTIINYSK